VTQGLQLAIAALIADSAVQALVADTTTTPTSYKVSPVQHDQEVSLPAVVGQHIAGTPMTSLAGDTSNLDQQLVQLDCMALTYDGAHALASAVRTCLAQQPKVFYPAATPRDDYDDTVKTHTVSLDYYVWVRRT
jgi:hypothetical protein